jgi:hypothetical protein
MTLQSNSGTYNFTGLGHQVSSEVKKMEAVKASLQDAAQLLGFPSEHVELQRLINAAIEEADSLSYSADEKLNADI